MPNPTLVVAQELVMWQLASFFGICWARKISRLTVPSYDHNRSGLFRRPFAFLAITVVGSYAFVCSIGLARVSIGDTLNRDLKFLV